MPHINSLLVALDFRETSAEVCQQAVIIAKKLNTTVTLIHAVEYLPYYPYYPYDTNKVHDDLFNEIGKKLEGLKEEFVKAGVVVNNHIIKEGKAYKIICDTADEIKACSILIGVGDHYLLENLIGSTADKVVRMANQAVFLLNHQAHKLGIKKILCGYDFSENAQRALNSSVYMAKVFSAKLDILHVAQEYYSYIPVAPIIEPSIPIYLNTEEELKQAKESVDNKLKEVIANFNIKDISYETHVRLGEPVREIEKFIRETDADLLVIGSSGHNSFVRFFLGSTTEKLIRKAPCSIMTVKEAAAK